MLFSEVIAPSTVLQVWQNSISKNGLFKLQTQNLRVLIPILRLPNIQITILERGILYRILGIFLMDKRFRPNGCFLFWFHQLLLHLGKYFEGSTSLSTNKSCRPN